MDTVMASADMRVGTQVVKDGLDISNSTNPIENMSPPSSVAIRTPVICPLITAHASDEPVNTAVVINVLRNVSAPTAVNMIAAHCNPLLCVEGLVGVAGAGAGAVAC